MNQLDPTELDSIVPFSGTPNEMALPERAIESGHALQQTKTAYTTAVAVQKPRSMTQITQNLMVEAKFAGASFYYSWMVKDRKTGRQHKIEGPSIDLAMSFARSYGNCALDVEVTESPAYYVFRGIFIDLETGFTCPRLFRQRKGQNIGKFDDERAEDIVFQIGQSKAIRNAIIRAMPKWLVDKLIEIARTAELEGIKKESPEISKAKAIDFLAGYGVTQDRIEAKIGRVADKWTNADILTLRENATALKEGRISALELFPEIEDVIDTEEEKPKRGRPPKPEEPQQDEIPLDGEKTGIWKMLDDARENVPDIYEQVMKELGLKSVTTEENAKKVIARCNELAV